MATSFSSRITVIITLRHSNYRLNTSTCVKLVFKLFVCLDFLLFWFNQSFHFNYGCMDGRGHLLHSKTIGIDKAKEIVNWKLELVWSKGKVLVHTRYFTFRTHLFEIVFSKHDFSLNCEIVFSESQFLLNIRRVLFLY